MHPNGGENQPIIEVVTPQTGEAELKVAPEKRPTVSPENAPQRQSTQVASQVASDLALPATAIMTTDDQSTTGGTSSTVSSKALDTDRIEKEWIDKAKTVIAQTKDDPFEQKNAMSRVKAEYIQKKI